MKLQHVLNNKNWRPAQYVEDEDGGIVFDETDGLERSDVQKCVTMDGELYHFIRVQHPWYRRILNDVLSRMGGQR